MALNIPISPLPKTSSFPLQRNRKNSNYKVRAHSGPTKLKLRPESPVEEQGSYFASKLKLSSENLRTKSKRR